MSRIIGIDLGTTNSVVAVMEEGKPVIIPNAEGERITPSVVAFDLNTRQLVVGTPAKRQAVINPQNTIFSIKRFVGLKFGAPVIRRDMEFAPYKVCATSDGNISVWMGERAYAPAEILAILLEKLKRDAEAYLGQPVKQAVITVPAYFNDSQRQATKDAGCIAGLDVLRIINEPTAASLAYGLHKSGDITVAVYHMGGGTLDISILDISQGIFEVKATNGDTHMGGDDFDQCIMDWVCSEFKREQGVDLRQDRVALQRLKWAAEEAKCALSTVLQTEINLPYITVGSSGDYKHLLMTLTKAKLEGLVSKLIEKSLMPCKQALADINCSTTAQIDEVVLIGQQTRMPAVREAVTKFFGKNPLQNVDPAEVVAQGAAVQAGVFEEQMEVLLLDVIPLTLSVETLGGVATPLINRNTTLPTRKSEIFSTAVDNQTSVDIKVYQGEHAMSIDNVLLGQFRFEGISPAPKSVTQIEVTFDVDANSILNVSARDKVIGREKNVTIIVPGTDSAEVDLEAMRARVDAGIMLDKVEKSLSEQCGCLTASARHIVDSKVAALRLALQSENATWIRRKIQECGVVLRYVEAIEKSDSRKAEELLVELLVKEEDKQVREYIRQALRHTDGAKVDEVLRPRTWIEKLLGRRHWADS